MPQPLVLAIEPDLRQAAIVKRIVREKVLADVTVVDSRESALEAMRTTIPDVLLLSALMSPRDEDELIAHLRTLENADHLQTHTIPQLASTLNPIESRGSRGLLSAFRRKKEPEVAPSGCDPDLFAEEIRVFLQQAADKKRERANARPDAPATDTTWRTALTSKAAAPAAPVEAAEGGENSASSSWSSPFEWKPSSSSSPMGNPEPSFAHPEPFIADPESTIADLEAQAAIAESLMSHLRPRDGIPTLDGLSSPARFDEAVRFDEPARFEEPVRFDEPVVAPAPIEVRAVETVPETPAYASEPIDVPEPAYVPEPVQVAAPIYVEAPVPVAQPVAVAATSPSAPVNGARLQDSRPKIKDSGLGIREERRAMMDTRLGALASWARAEGRARDAAHGSDDLRGLLTGLAVPSAVVAVGYGRGCRIRRVRVPAAREPHETEAVGAVIISRRALAEQRGLREQPQA